MFSFFKKAAKIEVPKWASCFNSAQYSSFIAAIENYFHKRDIAYTITDDAISAKSDDFDSMVLVLSNLAQRCAQNDTQQYEDLVTEHFESMRRANIFAKELKKIEGNYEQIKKHLGVRLYSREFVLFGGSEIKISIQVAGDVYAVLIFDLPESVSTISPETANKWGKTTEELFAIGIENIKNNYVNQISIEDFGSFNAWLVQGEHSFVPTAILDLKNHPKFIGSKGSVIGVPHGHLAIIYPIENSETFNAVTKLIRGINLMYEDRPDPLSKNLFWYKDGVFKDLPYKLTGDKINFLFPEDFINLLRGLPEVGE